MTRPDAKVNLIISTRDRPEYLSLAVESAVKQTRKFNRIIISDNSSTAAFKSQNKKKLKSIIDNQNGLVEIFSTPSDMPSDVHTKYIQDNYLGDSDFVTLFHDDDELFPTYVQQALKHFEHDRAIVAVGLNAKTMINKKVQKRTLMGKTSGGKTLRNKADFIKFYMDIGPISPPPFCGYLYRTDVFKKVSVDSTIGGKYSDVVGLTQLFDSGFVKWDFDPQLYYRLHSNQNSQSPSTLDFRSLYNFMNEVLKTQNDTSYTEIYRFKHIRLIFRRLLKQQKFMSAYVAGKYLASFAVKKLMWRPETYQYVWRVIAKR